MKRILFFLAASVLMLSCKNNEKKEVSEETVPNKTTQKTQNDSEWTYLFNGKDAEGWRGYNDKEGSGLPQGWVIEDGTLKSLGKGGDIGGDIIYAKEKYGNFDLSLEWKLSPQGNSGVFYHVVEDDKYEAPYFTGPEYQIIDSENFPEKLEDWQKIGADYGMYVPDYKNLDLPDVTNWNTSRIRVTDDKVTYWLNGQKTVEFDPQSEEWQKRKEEGKWKDYPDYGNAKTGYIGLQDHGSEIWFRNIKIKKL
ncbi:DUF1080 domain-containing protein [Christiangramia fulva]|uniref:DUF1080 domain-containing protein n=1 Tax=Christiangramia fulva TaxID=2126553 RepID=A0A2R3Z4C1_9FLAO|nr:DUF1080 domain-containing protein [Christiangramia fulva]AVR45127.1 DUF1080 domain-containing protein [Christiangramia fulva]